MRVSRMPDRQIYAIYETAKKPGGRLDEKLREVLLSTTHNQVERAYLMTAPAWKIYEMYNAEYQAVDITPQPVYHQMNMFEYMEEQHG